VGWQWILILRTGWAAALADVLHRDQKQPAAWPPGELRSQPRDDLVDRWTLRNRLKRDEHRAGIDLAETAAAAHPGIADDVLNRGIPLHDLHHLAKLLRHQLKRHALVSLQ